MRRINLFVLAIVAAVIPASVTLSGTPQDPRPIAAPTCDRTTITADSYRLTTEAQARNVLRTSERWWEPYGLWQDARDVGDLNEASTELAERAQESDEQNLLAAGYLARQYVVMAVDAQKAERQWRRVIDNGGAIVWTGTLYEVDPRSFFLLAFDANGIRVYRFTQLAGEVHTHFGVPDYPTSDRVEFWRALGGCLPSGVDPEATIPWASVRALRATSWTLRFDLRDKVAIASDRRQQRTDDTLEVNLHPASGAVDFRFGMTPFGNVPLRADPAAYHMRVRQMLVTVFDGAKRIGS